MGAGRPTKYKPEYAEQAMKYCLLGADDERLARMFEVDVSTINKWKLDYPEFSESIKNGKERADAIVADSLFHRARGYSHKAVKMFVVNGKIEKEEYDEHYPPDTGAAMAWLKNRQKQYWRDTQHIQQTTIDMTDEEIDRRLAEKIALINAKPDA